MNKIFTFLFLFSISFFSYSQTNVKYCNHNACIESPKFQSNLNNYMIYPGNTPVFFSTKIPLLYGLSKYAIMAEIHFGESSERIVSGNTVTLQTRIPDSTLIFSKAGWVDIKSCGVTYSEVTNNCGWYENESMNLLRGELVFQDLTYNTNLVISYFRTVNQELTHKGYLYQCSQFFSVKYPFCNYLGV